MRLGAPMIASTGQATMHLVQPMHTASSTRAFRWGPSVPHDGIELCERCGQQRGEFGDRGAPARGASVDRRQPVRDRLRIRAAAFETAAGALRLRQDRVDQFGKVGGHVVGATEGVP